MLVHVAGGVNLDESVSVTVPTRKIKFSEE